MAHIKMVTQIADWALAYTVHDIFGTKRNAYLNNRGAFWDLFAYYKDCICREIANIDFTISF